MKENMKLWEQVCVTDPAITRYVDQRGGFTAIDAQAQLKRATELWGPYGSAWGVSHLLYSYVRGKEDGVLEAALTGTFYYPVSDNRVAFEISTDIAYRPGNDSRKKLLTDLTTKALSKLGFNSDVFEGKFDDNKYVQELKKAPPPATLRDTNVALKKKEDTKNVQKIAQGILGKAQLIKYLTDKKVDKLKFKAFLKQFSYGHEWGDIASVQGLSDEQAELVHEYVQKHFDEIFVKLPF